MRAKEYPLLLDCLLVGARRATNRTLKYMDKDSLRDPDVQAKVEEEFVDCSLTEICERFDLDPNPNEQLDQLIEALHAYLEKKPPQGQPPQDGKEDDEGEAQERGEYGF